MRLVRPTHCFGLQILALITGSIVTTAGCGGPARTDTGAANIVVQALQIGDVKSVIVTVASAGLPAPIGVRLVRAGNQFSALAGNLPVGSDYTFTASAANGATPPVELYHGAVTNQVIQKNATAKHDRGPRTDRARGNHQPVCHGHGRRRRCLGLTPFAGTIDQQRERDHRLCANPHRSVVTVVTSRPLVFS